jgi:hypothetical protein
MKFQKRLKKVENHLLKFLDKKITVVSLLWIIFGVLAFVTILLSYKPKYHYIDENNNAGTAKNCYETKDEVRCDVPVRVKQYYKE